MFNQRRTYGSPVGLFLLTLLVANACGPASTGPPATKVDLAGDAVYQELNGIGREFHREIRQTKGTRLDTTPLEELRTKYDLSPRSYDCPIYFGQANVQPKFHEEGRFRGASFAEVAAKLDAGDLGTDEFPIGYIWVDGNKVTLNNRSLTLLYKAGMRPTTVIDRTRSIRPHSSESLESALRRLESMGGKPSTEMLVRSRGVGRDGKMKEATDWDAPIGEIVKMPDELLAEARICKRSVKQAGLKRVWDHRGETHGVLRRFEATYRGAGQGGLAGQDRRADQ